MFVPAKPHLALTARQQAHHRFHRRRFARAVAAHQRDDFAAADFEADVEQDVRAAIERIEAGDFQHRLAHCSALVLEGRLPLMQRRTRLEGLAGAEIDFLHTCVVADRLGVCPRAISLPRASTIMRSA